MLPSSTTLSLTALILASSALAYPAMDPRLTQSRRGGHDVAHMNEKRAVFDADAQRIDVSGTHAFVAPGPGDLRGPCPGLNALANHNYLPKSGVTSLTQAVEATNRIFGMSVDLGTFLSTYATLIDGNPLGLSWSIGGAQTGLLGLGDLVGNGLLATPQGLSGSHNKYESDASPGRWDAGLNNGDASSVEIRNFQGLYGLQPGDSGGDYNYDVVKEHARNTIRYSRANNPTFFWGPFSGVIVSQAAYTFIPAFMSNHSAENPKGFLDQTVLKSFFGVTGTQGNLKVQQGWERIPENWYRRPIGVDYSIPIFALENNDFLLSIPERLAIGGNMGQAGKFAGVDVSDLTGGVYNAQSLAQGNNALCFAYQSILTLAPDILKGLVSDVTSVVSSLTTRLAPSFGQLNCPQINYYNKGLFNQPGAKGLL